jgi:hypothetical protein
MAERTESLTAASAPRTIHDGSYVDWPALIAGAFVAAAIGVLFTSFGATLGLSAISAEQGEGAGNWALVIVGAWLLFTTIAAYGAGGYVAGRMRRRMDLADADEVSARDWMHGLVVWSLGLLFSAWMAAGVIGSAATAVGQVAGTAASAVGAVAQGAGSAVGGLAKGAASAVDAATGSDGAGGSGDGGLLSGIDVNPIALVNQRLLRGTGVQIDRDPTLPDNSMAILMDVVRTGEITADDRQWLALALAQNSNLTPQEAEARIDQAVTEVQQLRDEAAARVQELQDQAAAAAQEVEDKARAAAEAARHAAVLTGFVIAAAALIAAVAAVWGASLGGRHRDEGRIFGGFRGF